MSTVSLAHEQSEGKRKRVEVEQVRRAGGRREEDLKADFKDKR